LHFACASGHAETVRLLLDAGAKVDDPTKTRWSSRPLHIAAERGHERVVALLLRRGADPAALDADKQTALHLAARNNRASAAARLVAAGASIEPRGYSVPVEEAASRGHLSVLMAILPGDAPVARGDALSRPLLERARSMENADLIRLLQAWRNRR
jgi:ankyrin repeat protein